MLPQHPRFELKQGHLLHVNPPLLLPLPLIKTPQGTQGREEVLELLLLKLCNLE